jgi:hypothetical protein
MIIGDLEYLISSLPYLSFSNNPEYQEKVKTLFQSYIEEGEEEMDPAGMLDLEAAKFVSGKSLSLLRDLELDRIHESTYRHRGSRVLEKFSQYVLRQKEALKEIRLHRKDSPSSNGRQDTNLLSLEGSPLEQEVQLMKYQWEQLEELSGGHYADLEALILYKLKLLVLLRWWHFDARLGFKRFLELTKEKEYGGEDPDE